MRHARLAFSYLDGILLGGDAMNARPMNQKESID